MNLLSERLLHTVVVWSLSYTSVPRPQQVTTCTSAGDLDNTPAVHIECNLESPIKIVIASLMCD